VSRKCDQISLLKLALSYSSVLLWPILNSVFIRQRVLAPQIVESGQISAAILAYEQRFGSQQQVGEITDRPVFVFSAGWGSGSTLLQRLLISSGELTIWGEPVDEAGPLLKLADSISAIREDWPPEYHFKVNANSESLSREWIANYSPEMSSLKKAHRLFFVEWLSDSQTVSRWGLKEVRLTIDHAIYLKWLFPKARFVFIYRDVYSSYLSVRRRAWLSLWPGYSATSIVAFAHHWNYLLSGFIDRHQEVDGLLVKYEDLISDSVSLDKLAEHVGVAAINKNILNSQVGKRSARRKPLMFIEKLILDRVTKSTRKKLGYS